MTDPTAHDEAATQARFEALQRKLVPLWRSIRAMRFDTPGATGCTSIRRARRAWAST